MAAGHPHFDRLAIPPAGANARAGGPGPSAEGSASRPYGQSGRPVSPAVSGCPVIRFAFCTAWPAAPLPRLSIAPMATTSPVCGLTGVRRRRRGSTRWSTCVRGLRPFVDRRSSDERLVARSIDRAASSSCDGGRSAARPRVAGGEDAARHRHEVRRESQRGLAGPRGASGRSCISGTCGCVRQARRRGRPRSSRRSRTRSPPPRPVPLTPLLASITIPSGSTRPSGDERRQREQRCRRVAAGFATRDESRDAARAARELGQAVCPALDEAVIAAHVDDLRPRAARAPAARATCRWAARRRGGPRRGPPRARTAG